MKMRNPHKNLRNQQKNLRILMTGIISDLRMRNLQNLSILTAGTNLRNQLKNLRILTLGVIFSVIMGTITVLGTSMRILTPGVILGTNSLKNNLSHLMTVLSPLMILLSHLVILLSHPILPGHLILMNEQLNQLKHFEEKKLKVM